MKHRQCLEKIHPVPMKKGLVSPLLKGNGVTKVNEALIDIAPRNDEAKQRQLILNETPPMFGEDSSSSETASPRIELNEPTFYHISPCISRPLSEMTEEEQLEICQRLAIIGQMSSTIVREEDKLKDEKEIKSDTGTMIDQSTVTNKHVN